MHNGFCFSSIPVCNNYFKCLVYLNSEVRSLHTEVRNFCMPFFVFDITHALSTDAKMQKIEPDPKKMLWQTKILEVVCNVIDTT